MLHNKEKYTSLNSLTKIVSLQSLFLVTCVCMLMCLCVNIGVGGWILSLINKQKPALNAIFKLNFDIPPAQLNYCY